MKTCSKCGRELPLEAFALDKKGKDGRSCHCKECRNRYYKEAYKRGKRTVDSYKTQCAKCGCGERYVLTFHHIDHRTKSFEISGSHRREEEIVKELEKCICLCYNCHHTFHYFYGGEPNEPTVALNEFLKEDWKPKFKIN